MKIWSILLIILINGCVESKVNHKSTAHHESFRGQQENSDNPQQDTSDYESTQEEQARIVAQGQNICGHLDIDLGIPDYSNKSDQWRLSNWPTTMNVKINSDVDIYKASIFSNTQIKNGGPYGNRGKFIIKGWIDENSHVVLCPKNKDDFVFGSDWVAKPDGLYFQFNITLYPMTNPLTKERLGDRSGRRLDKRITLEDSEGCWCWDMMKIDDKDTIVIFYEKHDGTSCCQNS